LTAGLLPQLLLHLVLEDRGRIVRLAFYGARACVAAALALDDLDLASAPLRDDLPAVILGAAAVLGLFLMRAGTRLQLWYRWLLVLTAAISAASLVHRSAVTVIAPDYLLLSFFCVSSTTASA
jgi:hypothetical protein